MPWAPSSGAGSVPCWRALAAGGRGGAAGKPARLLCQHLTVDGDYGPLTEAAVKVAQRDAGVTQDGVYGPQTRDAITWYDGTHR